MRGHNVNYFNNVRLQKSPRKSTGVYNQPRVPTIIARNHLNSTPRCDTLIRFRPSIIPLPLLLGGMYRKKKQRHGRNSEPPASNLK